MKWSKRWALALCLNRLLAPKPLYKVEHWFADTFLPGHLKVEASKLNDDRLAGFIDDLAPHQDEVWRALSLRALVHYNVDLPVILYDLTFFYFEGDYADSPTITYGYSRDRCPDTKQRVVALNVSGQDGVPVLYSPLAGNTADCTPPRGELWAAARLPAPPAGAAALAPTGLRPGLDLVGDDRARLQLTGASAGAAR